MSCVVSFCPNSDAEESHPVSAASCCLLLQCVCVCVCVCDGEEEVVAGEKDSGKGLWWGALLGTELEEL